MVIDNFDRLEDGITRLLADLETLRAENRGLKEVLKAKEAELEALGEKVVRLDREKGLVKEKVDGLLERLEGLIQSA